MFNFIKRHHREKIGHAPFPDAYRAIIERTVPYVAHLSADEQAELRSLILIFLDEKTFQGCGGVEITDEIRVTIAAQACLLLLHRETDIYPDLDTILIYPSTYRAKTRRVEGGVVLESDEARLGESWKRGSVVLAWDSVRAGATNIFDGHNVTLHEFAHQLDAEDGEMNGTPDLGARSRYTAWGTVLGHEYDVLAAAVHAGRATDIDAYGSVSPPEFFAVVTELFFEKPKQLKRKHPDLYVQLQTFYRQDPAAR